MSTKKDWTQVIKDSYDDASGGLKTIPAASTSFSIELDASDGDSIEVRSMAVDTIILQNNLSAASNNTSAAVDISKYRHFAVAVNWVNLTGTLNGTIQLQASLDDAIYINIESPVTLAATPGSTLFNLSDRNYKYFKVVYTANGISGGNFTSKYMLKG